VSVNTDKFNIDASNGNTGIAGTLGVTGITTLNNSVFANGQVKITKNLSDAQDNYANYPLQIESNYQGIAIKLFHPGEDHPTQNNNFISFLNKNGQFRGRIEGYPGGFANIKSFAETLVDDMGIDWDGEDEEEEDPEEAEYPTSQQPVGAAQIFSSNAAYEGYERAIDFFAGIFRFATNLAAATLLCVGGDCDDVIWSAVDMGIAAGKLGFFIYQDNAEAGVSYESGGADYAEWLPKFVTEDKLSFGDVVGVRGGIISKTFKDADKFMIVSFAPAVIGGMPEMGKEEAFEKIAFMGQVMVKVMGEVKRGDYILPSGNGDGFAIAVSPDKMKALDYKRVIGVAWGESDGKDLFKYVKTAVGINTNDMSSMIDNMQAVMNSMQDAIKKVSPGYVPSYFSVNGSYAKSSGGFTTMPTLNEQLKAEVGNAEKGQDLAARLKEVQTSLQAKGVDLSKYKLIDRCLTNPTKENAEMLAKQASKALTKLQATYAAGMALKQSGN
jgi:hypothetical protein